MSILWNARLMMKRIALAASFVILTLIAWLSRDILTLANFTVIYVLFVLIVAIRLGTYAAMSTALASSLSINFFLTQPYYTFLVGDSRDVLDLTVFIIVAILAGQVGARARNQAEVAHQRAKEQEILYKLTRLMNQAMDKIDVLLSLEQVLTDDLGASHVDIIVDNDSSSEQLQDNITRYISLKTRIQTYGIVKVTFAEKDTTIPNQLLNTCVTQAAMALQRIELSEKARASQRFEEADRLKTAILRAVSHDLRTPITVIKTAASNLDVLGERMTDSERQDIARGIEKEVDHLNTLVGNLLDLSRLQAGALKLNLELNSLEEVAGDVAARVWQSTGREQVQIQFPDDMPLIRFDHGLILQAVTNLVDNAVRYEPAHSQILISGVIQGEQAVVRIINHGKTIPPDKRAFIMEPFIQNDDGGQVGLGLPIAKGIVEAHQGELRLEETPGGGMTFLIILPLSANGQHPHEAEDSHR